MNKLIILILVFVFYGIRIFINVVCEKKSNYLFVSLFVFLIPFCFTFFAFPQPPEYPYGAFNQTLSIEPFMLLIPFMLLLAIKKKFLMPKTLTSISVLLVVFVISFINPFNLGKSQTFIFFIRLVLLFISFYLLTSLYSLKTINKGIFDAFFLLVSIQLVLVICYPVLGIEQVLTFFKNSEDILFYAMERGGRQSAIGIFMHPGNLGLFSCMAFAYFFSTYLSNYKKQKSIIALILIFPTIILSFSRASWISFIFMAIFIIISYKKKDGSLFSIKSTATVLLFSVLLLSILISFTPLGIYFQNNDFNDMKEARFVHWLAGWEVIKEHFLFGVGINSHLKYINTEMPTLLDGFYAKNPIHNIHIIILVETGIIGFILWILFFVKIVERCKYGFHNFPMKTLRIFSLALVGVFVAFFIYGFFGWAGFQIEQITMILFFIYIFFYSCQRQKILLKKIRLLNNIRDEGFKCKIENTIYNVDHIMVKKDVYS